jgi:hypothetical protein
MKRFALAVLAALLIASLVPVAAEARYRLTYHQAKKAAKKKGHRVAHKRVRVSTLFRQSAHRYYAQVKWKHRDPNGCTDCGYDPGSDTFYDTPTTESCFAEINVRRSARTGHIHASVESKSCF